MRATTILKVIPNRKIVTNALPAHLTTLSVSWLNNQFKARAVHRGVLGDTFERVVEGDGLAQAEALMREAVQKTGYRGQTVSLVLAHPRLVQQFVELPPVETALLGKLIQRQAQQQKFFSGDAAWAYQLCVQSKSNQRVILHLFPRTLLNQLVQGCKANGLHLTAVLPTSAVLHRQAGELGLGKEEVGVIAAETGGSTTLVFSRGDGEMLLARTLPGTWNEDPERLALDLNRTILFVNQQYSLTTNKGLWLFGPGAVEQAPILQRHIKLPVQVSPVAYDPFYWASESNFLRAASAPNLVSVEQQKAPQRRIFAKAVVVSTVVLVALALAATAYSSFQARQEEANIKLLSSKSTELQARQQQLQKLDGELSRKKQLVELVVGHRPPPAAAWMLAYLGEAVPPDLVVTNLEIKRVDESWKVHLAGAFQPTMKKPASPAISSSMARLKAQLSAGPFHVTLNEPGTKSDDGKSKSEKTTGGIPDWLRRVTNSVAGEASPSKPTPENFVLDGVMR